MLLNDSLGDCVCAGAGHAEMLWTANASTEFVPTDNEILAAYEAIGGYNPSNPETDQGCDMLSALNFWRNTGICGHKIDAFTSVETFRLEQVRASIALFGCAFVGVQLPESAMTATENGQPWTDTSDKNILGGHCILLVAYDQNGFTAITWGAKQSLTDGWLKNYADEAYAVLSSDFFAANGVTPSGLDLQALSTDLAAL